MPTYLKDVLSPGTFYATGLDGSRRRVTYTRADVDRLARRVNDMVTARRQVPVCWDHQDDARPLAPGEAAPQSASASAKNTFGWVKGASWAPPARSFSSSTFPTSPTAQMEKARYVSPEIIPDFEDGDGYLWRGKSITHVAVTPQPVRHRQGPFQPAGGGRLSLASRRGGVRLSLADREPSQGPGARGQESGVRSQESGVRGPEMADDKKKEGEGETEATGGPPLDKILAALEAKGIRLPDDTDEGNFMDRLYVAAVATAEGPVEEELPPPPEEETAGLSEAEQPVLMALRKRVVDSERKELARQIDELERRRLPAA